MATQFFGTREPLRRSDLAMIRAAIAKDWDVPAESKLAILRDVVGALNDESGGARLNTSDPVKEGCIMASALNTTETKAGLK